MKVTDALPWATTARWLMRSSRPDRHAEPRRWSVTLERQWTLWAAFTNTARVRARSGAAFRAQEDSATVEDLTVPEYGVDIKKSVTTEHRRGLAATTVGTQYRNSRSPRYWLGQTLGFEQTYRWRSAGQSVRDARRRYTGHLGTRLRPKIPARLICSRRSSQQLPLSTSPRKNRRTTP